MFKNLVYKNRTIRRYDENYKITGDQLMELIDLARMAPSSMNLQPLKFFIATDIQKNQMISQYLLWAGYLKEWECPKEGERPTAHIIIMRDLSITKLPSCDHGIAAQTIMLGAAEQGLGGCIHSAMNKKKLQELLNIPEQYEILLVLSLGKPKEDVIVEPVANNDIKYWRDEEGRHHVPKRKLEDIIIEHF